jgi:hypothetical protein
VRSAAFPKRSEVGSDRRGGTIERASQRADNGGIKWNTKFEREMRYLAPSL